ncbi:MAG: tyrosine-type recombinase/integrase [Myxococcota bacterium]
MPPYTRQGVWYCDFRAPDPQTGHLRRWRQSLGPEVRTKKEAEAAERLLRVTLERGAEPEHVASHASPPPRPPPAELPSAPFSGLAHRWLSVAIAPKRKPKTYQFYESICRVWLVPYFGDREASTIGPADIEALQAYITRTPSKRHARAQDDEGGDGEGEGHAARPPGAKTNNEIIGCLSSMLATAVKWRYLHSNPCDSVSRLPVPPPPLDFYDFHQTARWLLVCRETEPIWYSFFFTGFRTGLREGELFALHVPDLDLTGKFVRVARSYGPAAVPDAVTGKPVRCYLEGTPKNNLVRYVGLSPDLVSELRRHLGAQTTGLVWSTTTRPDGDTHLTRSIVEAPWARVTAAAGLPPLPLHGMRHSFASQLVMKGVPLAHVQALLGHSTIRMTERYAHLAPGFASPHVDVLDTATATNDDADPSFPGSAPLSMVGVTGFEPATT